MFSRRQPRPRAGRAVHRSVPASPRQSRVEALEYRWHFASDLVISEFMASNNGGLTDAFGEHSDWIELHNRGDAAQDLNGYFLTDSGTDLTMWRLPAVTLNPGGYLTVFASQRDLANAGSELHTN